MLEKITPARNKPVVLITMAKNAMANLFRSGANWVIVLFLPPLFVRVMDKPTYGVWMLLVQVAAYVTIFDSGLQTAIARFVARAEDRHDRGSMAVLLSSAGAVLITASLCAILLTIIASWQLNHIFPDIPPSLGRNARQAMLVIGLSVALMLPFSVLAGFYAGLQKNEINALAATAGRFVGALGTAWAAYHHRGLVAMAAWTAFGNLVQCVIYVKFSNLEVHNLLRLSFVSRSMMREFLGFCSAMFVTQFSSILISGMDIPIVGMFDFRSTAYYAVAATLANALTVPHSAIITTLMPVAAGMTSSDGPERMGQVLLKTTRFATAVLCLITLPLLLLMPLFLRLWVGRDYASHTLAIAEILVVAQFVRLTTLPYAMIGYAAGQLRKMLAAPIGEGLINLLISVIAVQIIGARGVALGTLAGAAVSVCLHFFVSLPLTDCVKVSRRQLAWAGILRPISYALIFFLFTQGLTHWLDTPLLQVALCALAEIALSLVYWSFCFNDGERNQIKGLFQHAIDLSGKLVPALRS